MRKANRAWVSRSGSELALRGGELLATEVIFEPLDDNRHPRPERSLDHEDIAGSHGGKHMRLQLRGCLRIAAAAADWKCLPQCPHLRTAAEHAVHIGIDDGVTERPVQLARARPELEHIAKHRDAAWMRTIDRAVELGLAEQSKRRAHR